MTNSKLHTWDFVAVGLYFLAVLAAGVYVSLSKLKKDILNLIN